MTSSTFFKSVLDEQARQVGQGVVEWSAERCNLKEMLFYLFRVHTSGVRFTESRQ